MKNNIDQYYTDFHKKRLNIHCYPSEFLIRTMLGSYPNLKLGQQYEGANILDLGCGDGRNMILFNNLKANIYGVEITQEICDGVSQRMENFFGITTDIRVGRNSNIPFDDSFFDYVVASSSMYYVDEGQSFETTLKELNRVIKPNGYLIATLPHPKTFILENAQEMPDSHFRIVNDPYGLRNGNIFKVFMDREHLLEEFSSDYEDISIGEMHDDYYGCNISLWLFTGQKK